MATTFFWSALAIILYTYIGYGFLLFIITKLKKVKQTVSLANKKLPDVTLIIPAYNEERWIRKKIENSLRLDYPKNKIKFFFISDGSNDDTFSIIRNYNFPTDALVFHFHKNERNGKKAAIESIMPFVDSPITIFTDANTSLNEKAILNIVRHFGMPNTGAVAGEKRVALDPLDDALAGESFYWQYESILKKWDAQLHSVVGAAGELFAVRTALFEPIPSEILIEDFYLTMRIAQKGYRVAYEPKAYAIEGKSASIREELKRKIRIAAGGIQAVIRLYPLLNIFKYSWLSFQYISHRVLRWTLAPLSLPILLASSFYLASNGSQFYFKMIVLQLVFYTLAILGYVLERFRFRLKAFFIPYYFCIMNYAVFKGSIELLIGKQSAIWAKAERR